MSSSICCRAACHLLDTLIRLKSPTDMVPLTFTKHFLSSLDVNAPATVSEASISLVVRVFHKNTTDNPSTFVHDAESILRWFYQKWRPSE